VLQNKNVRIENVGDFFTSFLKVGGIVILVYETEEVTSEILTIEGVEITVKPSKELRSEPIGAYIDIPFHHGHPTEVVNHLSNLNKSAAMRLEKFPCICLFHDFPQDIGNDGYQASVSLNIVIANATDPRYTAEERITNSFKAVLYPMLIQFIKCVKNSIKIDASDLDYRQWDRLLWGKTGLYGNTANIFNDFIDAIELENFKIKILKYC